MAPPADYGATAIVARPSPEAASTTHVHGEDLAAVPIRTAEDALRLVPGLILVQHGSEGKGQQFFLRGFDAMHGADLELSVEDIPINEWSNIHAQGYLDVGFVIPEAIQTVEVIKGPFSLDQGAFAMAGSARYRLGVAPTDLGARAGYTVGTTGRQRLLASYSPREGDGSQFVAAEVMNDPSYGQSREARRTSAMGRIHLLDSETRGRLSLLLSLYAAEFGLPGAVQARDVERGKIGFYDAYYRQGQGHSTRALGALTYSLERAGHRVRGTIYGSYRKLDLFDNFTGYLYDPVHGDYRDQRQTGPSLGARAVWTAPLMKDLSLVSGLGIRGDYLRQKERRTDADGNSMEIRRALHGLQALAHLELGLNYRPSRAFQVEAGVRGDLVFANLADEVARDRSRAASAALSPRALASLRLSPMIKLFAAYGRGLRPPEARAFTRFKPPQLGLSEEAANPAQAHITQSHALELGARVRPTPVVSTTVSGFATWIARESVFDHVSGLNLELNGTRRLGGEAILSLTPLPWLRMNADLTAVSARFVASGNPVPFAPWLTSGARVVLVHPSGARAGLRFVAVAPRPLPHGARGEALYMLDATAGYRRNWFDVGVALENLLFRELREGEYHFASHWRADEPPSAIPTTQVLAGPPFNARLTLSVFL